MDDIIKTMRISGAGMRAQGNRLRVISQNIANVSSLPQEPGGKPYQRKVITFKNVLDRSIGLETVRTAKVQADKSEFKKSLETLKDLNKELGPHDVLFCSHDKIEFGQF